MDGSMINFPPGDPRLVDKIVCQLKSQGIFDRFRKECIADVDTKPAYQNLHQRVEGTVAGFLANQEWRQELNKNQLRDSLRKHIHESGFLDIGLERIVDQVVNPKILTVLLPQIEDVVYNFLGLEKPKKKFSQNIATLQSAKPFKPLKMETLEDLLPKDLDPISPGSVGVNSDDENEFDATKKDVKEEPDNEDEKIGEEEDSSPPFEPIEKVGNHDENSLDSHLSGISGLTSHDSQTSNLSYGGECHPVPESNTLQKVPPLDLSNQDSQLSKVSSGSRLSIVFSDEPEKSDVKNSSVTSDMDLQNDESQISNIDEPVEHEPQIVNSVVTNEESNHAPASEVMKELSDDQRNYTPEPEEVVDASKNLVNDEYEEVNSHENEKMNSHENEKMNSHENEKIISHENSEVFKEFEMEDKKLDDKERRKERKDDRKRSTASTDSRDSKRSESAYHSSDSEHRKSEKDRSHRSRESTRHDEKKETDKPKVDEGNEKDQEENKVEEPKKEEQEKDVKGIGKDDKLDILGDSIKENGKAENEREKPKIEIRVERDSSKDRGDGAKEKAKSEEKTDKTRSDKGIRDSSKERVKGEDKDALRKSHHDDRSKEHSKEKNRVEERDVHKEKSEKEISKEKTDKLDKDGHKEKRHDDKSRESNKDKTRISEKENIKEKLKDEKAEKEFHKEKKPEDKSKKDLSKDKSKHEKNERESVRDRSRHEGKQEKGRSRHDTKEKKDDRDKIEDKAKRNDKEGNKEKIKNEDQGIVKNETDEDKKMKAKSDPKKDKERSSKDKGSGSRHSDSKNKTDKSKHEEKSKETKSDSKENFSKHDSKPNDKSTKDSKSKSRIESKEKDEKSEKKEMKRDDRSKEKSKEKSDREKSEASKEKQTDKDRQKDDKSDKEKSKDTEKTREEKSEKEKPRDEKERIKSKEDRSDREKQDKSKSAHSDTPKKGERESSTKSRSSNSTGGGDKSKDGRKRDSKEGKARAADDHSVHRERRSDDRRSTDRDSNGAPRGQSASNAKGGSSTGGGGDTHGSRRRGVDGGGGGGGHDATDSVEAEGSSAPAEGSPLHPLPIKKRPVQSPDADEGPGDEYATSVNSAGKLVLKLKKPKIAANIFEVRKIMHLRKSMAKIERKKQRVEARSNQKAASFSPTPGGSRLPDGGEESDGEELRYFSEDEGRREENFLRFVRNLEASETLSDLADSDEEIYFEPSSRKNEDTVPTVIERPRRVSIIHRLSSTETHDGSAGRDLHGEPLTMAEANDATLRESTRFGRSNAESSPSSMRPLSQSTPMKPSVPDDEPRIRIQPPASEKRERRRRENLPRHPVREARGREAGSSTPESRPSDVTPLRSPLIPSDIGEVLGIDSDLNVTITKARSPTSPAHRGRLLKRSRHSTTSPAPDIDDDSSVPKRARPSAPTSADPLGGDVVAGIVALEEPREGVAVSSSRIICPPVPVSRATLGLRKPKNVSPGIISYGGFIPKEIVEVKVLDVDDDAEEYPASIKENNNVDKSSSDDEKCPGESMLSKELISSALNDLMMESGLNLGASVTAEPSRAAEATPAPPSEPGESSADPAPASPTAGRRSKAPRSRRLGLTRPSRRSAQAATGASPDGLPPSPDPPDAADPKAARELGAGNGGDGDSEDAGPASDDAAAGRRQLRVDAVGNTTSEQSHEPAFSQQLSPQRSTNKHQYPFSTLAEQELLTNCRDTEKTFVPDNPPIVKRTRR